MKKIRSYIKEIKEGYLTGKIEKKIPAYKLANFIFTFVVCLILQVSALVLCDTCGFIEICIICFNIILSFVCMFSNRILKYTSVMTALMLDKIFAKYGNVVGKRDWRRIKKKNKNAYKFIRDKKNIGYCYVVSWMLALWLDDAKLMYCSVQDANNRKTAHAVVLKNDCIYDTNLRIHYNYNEYLEIFNVEVYKIFDEDVYRKMDFFDCIREDFKKWCEERDTYCDPQ